MVDGFSRGERPEEGRDDVAAESKRREWRRPKVTRVSVKAATKGNRGRPFDSTCDGARGGPSDICGLP